MDNKQVNNALEKLFQEERIVFWNDPDREFIDYLSGQLFSPVEGVKILRLDQMSSLAVKIEVERTDPDGRFLIYSPEEEPDYQEDWLLDIRLYSASFRADRASIILQELGLQTQYLRDHLNERRKFFDNKERLQKLKAVTLPEDSADDLDLKMLAVAVKADQSELYNILRTLLHLYADMEDIDLRKPMQAWEQIERFDLHEPFWRFIKKTFGYAEETPSLENLLIRLMVTDFAQHLRGELPSSLEHLVLPQSGRANTVVCLAQWRDSASKGSSYDRLSEYVAKQINLRSKLDSFNINDLIEVQTFLDVEKEIAHNLKNRVVATADMINVEEIREIATGRQAKHWALPSVPGASSVPRQELYAAYEAMVTAAEFYDLKNRHQHGFEYSDAHAMYQAYENELYRFDQLYRHFCEFADKCQHWDIVKSLRENVEAAYSNWYITTLGLAWGKFVEGGLLEKWAIDDVPNQYTFYQKHVLPQTKKAQKNRVWVIISDAFRYEALHELMSELNRKKKDGRKIVTTTLSSQLSVLPSYTALGMASLLPHQSLEYDQKGNVLVNGKSCASTDQRNDVLSGVDGIAVKADELLNMNMEKGRNLVAGKKVVYIYHDEIDSRGEKLSTEGDTFDAVRKAIDELSRLVGFIVNSLNGSYIIVTADHGFLFSEAAPTETHKSKLEEKPPGTVIAKKRYLLGHDLPDVDEAYHGTTKVTAKAEGEMEFWIPKSANRFHFTGGARFIHGGAMPQEIVVPVLTIRSSKEKANKENVIRQVGVQVLGVNHRITTPKHRFQFLQSEPVSDLVKAITLKIAIYEGNQPVTNIEKVTFDSTSDNMKEWTKEVVLVLEDRTYDKKNKYHLVLRDANTEIEQSRVDITIDRAFTDDF